MIGHYDILPYERNKSLFNMLVESCHLPLLKDMCKRSTEIIMGPFAPSSYQNVCDIMYVKPNTNYDELIFLFRVF